MALVFCELLNEYLTNYKLHFLSLELYFLLDVSMEIMAQLQQIGTKCSIECFCL